MTHCLTHHITHCLTHHITHCLTHRITHPITKLDCMTYQDLSICTEEAKQSSYTISHTVAKFLYLILRHNMGIALPGYPPTGTRHMQAPAYVIPAGITTG